MKKWKSTEEQYRNWVKNNSLSINFGYNMGIENGVLQKVKY